MGIRDLQAPRCDRCNADSYEGELKIEATNQTPITISLCSYCLPIVHDKLFGVLQDHVSPFIGNH